MAESEQKVQQVQDPETPDDDEPPSNYKPPAKKTIEEIQKMDQEDESLVKYKKTLFGGDVEEISPPFPDDKRNVIVSALTLIVEGREDKVIDLTGDLSNLKEKPFVIKEGATYKLKINFYVQREIVSGLRYKNSVTRAKIPVDKTVHMVGSYGPKKEAFEFILPAEEAPKGIMARGSYKVNSLFEDDDKNVILQWTWKFEIKSSWD